VNYKVPLDDDSSLFIEDDGGANVQIRVSKGKVHRGLSLKRSDMKMLLFALKKWERDGRKK
jgi:hypothetical protein